MPQGYASSLSSGQVGTIYNISSAESEPIFDDFNIKLKSRLLAIQ
jgi:hypothetical protein